MIELPKGQVGIFWWVADRLLAAGCRLADAEAAGDWLDYPGGHADHWERWRDAGTAWLRRNDFPLEITSSEYEDHPRGRIVYDMRDKRFLLYADRRLQTKKRLQEIVVIFGLTDEVVSVRSDPHYRINLDLKY